METNWKRKPKDVIDPQESWLVVTKDGEPIAFCLYEADANDILTNAEADAIEEWPAGHIFRKSLLGRKD